MRKWLSALAAVTAIAWVAAVPSRATAWGKEGHELVGKIADRHLTGKARAGIDELLQGHQFQSLSDGRLTNWADAIRSSAAFQHKFPKMAKWHFIDISIKADLATLNLASFCENEDCVLGAVKKFQA